MTAADDQLVDVAEVYSEDGYYAVLPEWVLDADISALAVRLYAALRRYADQRTMHAHPSRRTLADRLKVKSVRTVDSAIAELKGIGALRTFARVTVAGDPDSNGYVLHREPRFDADGAPPAARGGAADCTTPRAADCTRVVQLAAPKPQPMNHSHGNHTPTPDGVGGAPERDDAEPAESDEPLPATEAPPNVDAATKPAKRSSKRTRIPAGWEPDERLTAWTREKAPGIPRAELDQFRDHHTARGSLMADWDAAWRTWVGNWARFAARGRPARRGPYRNTGHQDGTTDASWDAWKRGEQ